MSNMREVAKEGGTNYDYDLLIEAIIIQAVKDYRAVLKKIKKNPFKYEKEKKEIEKFFYSDWFYALSKLDPNMIIERVNKEVLGDECKRIHESSI